MNKSNSTAFVPDSTTILIVDILFQLDTVIRFSSAFIHIFYFWLVYKIVELRKLSLLYVHHANFVSFMFNLHYLVYYHYIHPDFGDATLNGIMCTISEVFWAMLKLLRCYSIALIATYRLVAVFKIGLYKKLNQSWIFMLIPLGVVYFICGLIFLVTKYSFGTTYGYLFCFDGSSSYLSNSTGYFIANALAGFIAPVLFTIMSYLFIRWKLFKLSIKIFSENHIINSNKNNLDVSIISNFIMEKQTRLAKQFFFMNGCELISSLMIIGLGMRYIITNLNEYNNIARFLMRSTNLFFQLLLPVTTMIYNVDICNQIKEWRNFRCCF